MTQTTDQELYEQWREDYALTYEPNYDEHLEADCKAAFLAGMQAARRAQVVQQETCVICGSDEPYTGTCGSNDPRALCKKPAPQPPEANSAEFDRIKAAPVPKFNHAAKRKLELLLGDGATITGYAIEKDGRRGAIDCHGFVYWWNDAAPVQMPEPWGTCMSAGKSLHCVLLSSQR